MTEAELKAEAKAMGYNLIKAEPYIRLKPCTCGCKRREHWYRWDAKDSKHYVTLRCKKCGKEVEGETEREAREMWNMMIEAEERDVHKSDI